MRNHEATHASHITMHFLAIYTQEKVIEKKSVMIRYIKKMTYKIKQYTFDQAKKYGYIVKVAQNKKKNSTSIKTMWKSQV